LAGNPAVRKTGVRFRRAKYTKETKKSIRSARNFLWTKYFPGNKVQIMKQDRLQIAPSITC
jgi:hypothetical protein